jgi:hypothetical protein
MTLLFCSSVVEARLGISVGEVFELWYGLQGCTGRLELSSSSGLHDGVPKAASPDRKGQFDNKTKKQINFAQLESKRVNCDDDNTYYCVCVCCVFQMKEITHLLLLLFYISTPITIVWSAPYSARTTEDARNLEDFVHKIKDINGSSERFTSKFELDFANIYNYNTIYNIVSAPFTYEGNIILIISIQVLLQYKTGYKHYSLCLLH